jgi:hypothetical protein
MRASGTRSTSNSSCWTLTSGSSQPQLFSLQSQTQRLGSLPGLLFANSDVAHGDADILLPGQFLDFQQILSHVVEEFVAALRRNPCAVISPTLSALHAARSRRLNARLENGSPEYPANTNCDRAKAIPPGATILRSLKRSWIPFHSLDASAWLRRPGTSTSERRSPCP